MLLISTASLENKEKYVFECAVGMKNEILCFDVERSCKITRILCFSCEDSEITISLEYIFAIHSH